MPWPSEEDSRQAVVLIRHFFGRFFRSSSISRDGDLSVALVEIVAPFAVIAGLACLLALQHRFFLSFIGERPDPSWLWVNESFHLSFAMIFTGLVTLLEWDELLLDQSDFANLACLPIRPVTLLSAKIASLLLFVGLVSGGANAFSAVLFPGLLSTGGDFGSGLWWFVVHCAVLSAACLTVFLACLVLQGLTLLVPGGRLPGLASLFPRWALVVTMFSGLVALPQIHSALPGLKAAAGSGLQLFPPMWFVGLYELALGRGDAVFQELGRTALLALGGVLLGGTAVYAFQYRRLLSGTQAWRPPAGGSRAGIGPARAATALPRDSAERAVFHFIAQTLFRRHGQLLIWAVFSGLGVALVVASWGKLYSEAGYAGLETPSWLTLSFLHLLIFFSLVGLRVVFSLPASLEANWVFRITEAGGAGPFGKGVRKAALLFGVLPWMVPVFFIHLGYWGWLAAAHCGFALAWALVLTEVLFFDFRKPPFACSFVPENVNLRLMWPFYAAGFATYVYGGSLLESWLLRGGPRYALGLASLGAAAAVWIRLKRRLFADGGQPAVYEEARRPTVVRMGLDEP